MSINFEELRPLIRNAGVGAIAGGGAAALLNLLHSVKIENDIHDIISKPPVEKIVIKLPRRRDDDDKRAEVSGDQCTAVSTTEKPEVGARKARDKDVQDLRSTRGTHKNAQDKGGTKPNTGDESMALWALGKLMYPMGGLAAYGVVDAAFKKLQMRKLKREEQYAQEDMIDRLIHGEKAASDFVDSVLPDSGVLGIVEVLGTNYKYADNMVSRALRGTKNFVSKGLRSADQRWRGFKSDLDKSTWGALWMLYFMGAGSTAYVSKHLADQHFKAPQLKKPIRSARPKRVVFETMEDEDVEAVPQADDGVKIAVAVEKERLRGYDVLFADPYVKAAMVADGIGPQDVVGLLKSAAPLDFSANLEARYPCTALMLGIKIAQTQSNDIVVKGRGAVNALIQHAPDAIYSSLEEWQKPLFKAMPNKMLTYLVNSGLFDGKIAEKFKGGVAGSVDWGKIFGDGLNFVLAKLKGVGGSIMDGFGKLKAMYTASTAPKPVAPAAQAPVVPKTKPAVPPATATPAVTPAAKPVAETLETPEGVGQFDVSKIDVKAKPRDPAVAKLIPDTKTMISNFEDGLGKVR